MLGDSEAVAPRVWGPAPQRGQDGWRVAFAGGGAAWPERDRPARQAGGVAALATRSTVSPRALVGMVGVDVGVITVVVAGPEAPAALVAIALVVGFAGFGLVLHTLHHGGKLPLGLVLGAGLTLTALCVAFPPAASKDVASYAFYGRIMTEYGENPYVTVPDDHPDDTWYPDVSERWRRTPSVYGPAFNALSAAVTAVGGENRTLIRVLFQGSAGLALLAAALAVARLTGDAAATSFVALNPVLLASVVNGAHNDALVGAALLGACLAARRRRWAAAGALLALAAGVKVTAVLAVPALVVWAWHRHGRRAAATVGATAGGLLAGAHLAFGPVAVATALADAGDQHSRSSVWRAAFGIAPDRLVGLLAMAASVALAAVLVRRHLSERTPELVVAASLIGYLLLGSYVLPWYHAWVLLPAAVAWRSRLALGSAAASAVLMLGYTWQPPDDDPASVVLREISHWAAPTVALVVITCLLRSCESPAPKRGDGDGSSGSMSGPYPPSPLDGRLSE